VSTDQYERRLEAILYAMLNPPMRALLRSPR
jgi:hypothetical protein